MDAYEKIIKDTLETPARTLQTTIDQTQKISKEVKKQKGLKKLKNYWNELGPGLTTGAADDDPSGIATYSQMGSQYGFSYLWLSTLTFPLMTIVQEMCARIGIVTGRGLAANIKRIFPKWVILVTSLLLLSANTINIGADLGAMAKSIQLIYPGFNFYLLVSVFTIISLTLQIFVPYKKYGKILKWMSLVIIAYIIAGFMVKADLKEVLANAFIPKIILSKESIIMICAFLGTSISPYLFFWQTSQEIEEEVEEGKTTIQLRCKDVSRDEIKTMRVDVVSGMFFSQLVAFFIVLTCAGALFKNGIVNIQTAHDAALALKPFAGEYAFFLFTLGIVGTGLLAIPVLAGSAAYTISEALGVSYGLHKNLKSAYAFYGVIIISMLIGFLLNLADFDIIKILIITAVINGIIAPIILALIVTITSNKKIMGEYTNSKVLSLLGWITTGVMAISAAGAIIALF